MGFLIGAHYICFCIIYNSFLAAELAFLKTTNDKKQKIIKINLTNFIGV